MKNKLIFAIALSSIFLTTSCQFSKGFKQDLKTGLKVSYNGFAIEEAYLTLNEEETKKLTSNKIPLGSKVNIWASGVKNFKEENGRVFPGCEMILTNKNGKKLLNIPDLFSDKNDGVSKDEATALNAKLTTGKPMIAGDIYNLKTRFFDKKNTENEIVAEVDLAMQ